MVPHVAMYIGSLTRGGAERVMVNLAEGLFARGWTVTLVTTYLGDDEYDVPHGCFRARPDADDKLAEPYTDGKSAAADADHIKVAALGTDDKPVTAEFAGGTDGKRIRTYGVSGSSTYIGRVFSGISSAEAGSRFRAFMKRKNRLEEIWRDLRPDVILSFIGKNNIMALMTARKFHIPVIVSVRAVPELEYPGALMKTAADALFPKASAVVMQTKAAAEFFSEKVQRKAVVVPNAVSREFTGDAAREEDRKKTITAVGRMDANKRFDLLLEAFAEIAKNADEEENKYRLLLYGDGEDRKKLEELAKSLGIAERTSFAGYQKGIAEKIRNAGVYCLMSDTEGMPNTLIEALCLGIPAVTTDCVPGGIRQLTGDDECALVIPVGDKKALEEAIRRIIHDEALARSLSENGRKLRERFDPDRVTDLWEKLLQDCIR